MRFVDLSERTRFQAACLRLWEVAASQTEWDAVVGIATGGKVVASAMLERHCVPSAIVKCQRGSTGLKNRIKFIIARLPRGLSRWLRTIEALAFAWMRRLRRKRRDKPGAPGRAVIWVEGDAARVQSWASVLVVDDAVDSGETMAAVIDFLKRAKPGLCIHTAVITTTMRDPLVLPDFTLYHETLVRFPWSMDVRNG